ncbi:MAG TPA: hypothetical protein VGD67_14505 [Pseudonocardiaceae bacterium]
MTAGRRDTPASDRVVGRMVAAQRFFELRASGYRGPIDQDGHAAPEDLAVRALQRLARDGGA